VPPILFGDPDDESITHPRKYIEFIRYRYGTDVSDMPDKFILTFKYTNAAEKLIERYGAKYVKVSKEYPIYIFNVGGERIALKYIGIGGPLAGAQLDECVAFGGRKFIVIGKAGVLRGDIPKFSLMVPNKAIRDEGTSYHYLRPSTFSYPSSVTFNTLLRILLRNEDNVFIGGTWTTDGIYRETKRKRDVFMRLGAICVEMELASLFAVAEYRKVDLAAILYADDFVGERWELRLRRDDDEMASKVVDKMLEYSIEALIEM